MIQTIYISIPMAGKPQEGIEYARMVEEVVQAMGADPVVPHDIPPHHDGDKPCPPGYSHHEGHSSACYLRGDIKAMMDVHGVVFGLGWEHSVGCRLEMSVAAHCGIPIYFVDRHGEITDTHNDIVHTF